MKNKLHDRGMSTSSVSRSRSRSPSRGRDCDCHACCVAIAPPLLLIVPDLMTEEVTPGLDTLIKSSSSKHTMQLRSIGRISRGNVPVVAADSLSRMRKGVMQLYEHAK